MNVKYLLWLKKFPKTSKGPNVAEWISNQKVKPKKEPNKTHSSHNFSFFRVNFFAALSLSKSISYSLVSALIENRIKASVYINKSIVINNWRMKRGVQF